MCSNFAAMYATAVKSNAQWDLTNFTGNKQIVIQSGWLFNPWQCVCGCVCVCGGIKAHQL